MEPDTFEGEQVVCEGFKIKRFNSSENKKRTNLLLKLTTQRVILESQYDPFSSAMKRTIQTIPISNIQSAEQSTNVEYCSMVKLTLKSGKIALLTFQSPQNANIFTTKAAVLVNSLRFKGNKIEIPQLSDIYCWFNKIKKTIFIQKPQLKQAYVKIINNFGQKLQPNSIQSYQLDVIVLGDHSLYKTFTRKMHQGFDIKQRQSMEDKLIKKKTSEVQINSQCLENYSQTKQLSFKVASLRINQEQQQEVQKSYQVQCSDLFVHSLLSCKIEFKEFQNLNRSGFILNYEEPKQTTLASKLKVEQKSYSLSFTKQQKAVLLVKDPNRQVDLKQFQEAIQMVKILYKLINLNQDNMAKEVKQLLTKTLVNTNLNYSYVQSFLKKTNENYLLFRKGRFIRVNS